MVEAIIGNINHLSKNAYRDGLKKMVEVLKPKNLVPIHTFDGDEYQDIFPDTGVKRFCDGDVVEV